MYIIVTTGLRKPGGWVGNHVDRDQFEFRTRVEFVHRQIAV